MANAAAKKAAAGTFYLVRVGSVLLSQLPLCRVAILPFLHSQATRLTNRIESNRIELYRIELT
jgi:hypothetical protein